MEIDLKSGLLTGAVQCPSPNHDERPQGAEPSLIVIHNISLPPNEFGGDGISELFTNSLTPEDHPFYEEIFQLKVASHLLIRRDGRLIQYVPFHLRAFHAGISSFNQHSNCNDFSVGIELEGNDYVEFTTIQYERLVEVIKCLCTVYPQLTHNDIVGHQHIAPERKTDPGPFFIWKTLSKALGAELPAQEMSSGIV